MKKIIAMLLALMLLLGMTAVAEEAAANTAVLTLGNASVSMNGETVDLEGMTATLSLNAADAEAPTLALSIDNDEGTLAAVYAQIKGNQFLISADGLDHTYAQEIPEIPSLPVEQLPSLIAAMVPVLDTLVLPPFTGVTIPKMDISGLLGEFATTQNADGFDFEIPAEMVKMILNLLVQAASQANIAQEQLDQVQQMLESMDVALAGSLVDTGDSQVVSIDLLMSSDGENYDTAVANLTISSVENSALVTVGVVMDSSGVPTPVATIGLDSDPDAATLDFEINAGVATIRFSLFNEDGLQKMSLTVEAQGNESAYLEFDYGTQDGVDIVCLAVSAGGADITFAVGTIKGDDSRTGTINLDMVNGEQKLNFSADAEMYLGMADSGITMPADVRPFSEFDQNEFSGVLAPVMEYLNTLEPAA